MNLKERERKKDSECLWELCADTLPAQSAKTGVKTHSVEKEMKAVQSELEKHHKGDVLLCLFRWSVMDERALLNHQRAAE